MSAVFSPCGLYRYRLDREVQLYGITAALIAINPSVAGRTRNDPTIRKDIGFAKVNGWSRIIKGNVFGFVSTDVQGLAAAGDPIGPDNERHLRAIIEEADIVIPCWGAREKVPKTLHGAIDRMNSLLAGCSKPVKTFGLTLSGDPKHPLMLAYATALQPWLPRNLAG